MSSTPKHDIEAHWSRDDATTIALHYSRSTIANPSPAGVFAFASTTFILSVFNVNARGIHTPNVVVGMALFSGGLMQFIAGMWEYPRGNVFNATVFSTYGCFWMSYAAIHIPATGIIAAYSDPQEFNNAMGIYLITWFVITVMFTSAVLRRNLTFIILLSILAVTFLLLAVANFTADERITKAGGALGIVVAVIAYYAGVSELLEAEARPIARLPRGVWY
ncbi:GPR1/FUN34/yaaH family-domain-containing protein [Panaeolus papilionaceus]|nr:GPR1/FUN34/yaaH family-domain-containing protein [Panaeolus papilionaceus]